MTIADPATTDAGRDPEGSPGDGAGRFSIAAGGPFHSVLRRVGWIGADQLPTARAAWSLALIAWLPPALLAVAQSVLHEGYSGWGYFTDPMVITRYLVAIWAMVTTERFADARITLLTRQFREACRRSRHGTPWRSRARAGKARSSPARRRCPGPVR